jgi:hypothetical protein
LKQKKERKPVYYPGKLVGVDYYYYYYYYYWSLAVEFSTLLNKELNYNNNYNNNNNNNNFPIFSIKLL